MVGKMVGGEGQDGAVAVRNGGVWEETEQVEQVERVEGVEVREAAVQGE